MKRTVNLIKAILSRFSLLAEEAFENINLKILQTDANMPD